MFFSVLLLDCDLRVSFCRSSDGTGGYLASAEFLSLDASSWSRGPPLLQPRASAAAAELRTREMGSGGELHLSMVVKMVLSIGSDVCIMTSSSSQRAFVFLRWGYSISK